MLPGDTAALLKGDPKLVAFLDYTLTKVSVTEDPLGSNRGPDIDAWAREFGSPLGSYWCALAVGHCRKAHGLWIPTRDVGSCDEWYLQAENAGLLVQSPVVGAAVLYGNGERIAFGRYKRRFDAVHIGTVVRTHPQLQSLEGNTTLGKYDRNGTVLTLKAVETPKVLGYILPRKLAA